MNVQTSSGESVTGSLRDVCEIFFSVEFVCCTCSRIMRVETYSILEEIYFLNIFLTTLCTLLALIFIQFRLNFGNGTKFGCHRLAQ
jgi:hypothetical protein